VVGSKIQQYPLLSHTHTTPLLHPFNGLFSRTIWVRRHQKGKPFWILLEQEVMGWQWHLLDHMQVICTLLQTDNYTTQFLQARCPSCRPTNSIKAHVHTVLVQPALLSIDSPGGLDSTFFSIDSPRGLGLHLVLHRFSRWAGFHLLLHRFTRWAGSNKRTSVDNGSRFFKSQHTVLKH